MQDTKYIEEGLTGGYECTHRLLNCRQMRAL